MGWSESQQPISTFLQSPDISHPSAFGLEIPPIDDVDHIDHPALFDEHFLRQGIAHQALSLTSPHERA